MEQYKNLLRKMIALGTHNEEGTRLVSDEYEFSILEYHYTHRYDSILNFLLVRMNEGELKALVNLFISLFSERLSMKNSGEIENERLYQHLLDAANPEFDSVGFTEEFYMLLPGFNEVRPEPKSFYTCYCALHFEGWNAVWLEARIGEFDVWQQTPVIMAFMNLLLAVVAYITRRNPVKCVISVDCPHLLTNQLQVVEDYLDSCEKDEEYTVMLRQNANQFFTYHQQVDDENLSKAFLLEELKKLRFEFKKRN